MKKIARPVDRDNVLVSQLMILDYFNIINSLISLNKSNFEVKDKFKKIKFKST